MQIQVDFYQDVTGKNNWSTDVQVFSIKHYFFNFKLIFIIQICFYSKGAFFLMLWKLKTKYI